MTRMTSLKRGGVAAAIAGLALSCWGMFGVLQGSAVTAIPTASDPGCTPSAAGPGVVTVCLNESQEGVSASSFSDQSCDNIDNRDPALDYFVFVLPQSGDPGRVFTAPSPTVFFDTGTTTGTIWSNAMFFFASAPPGATLLEASAHADNGSGTPVGGEAQSFNLTHTCPAVTGSVSGSSTTSTGTTTTETSTGSTTTETTTGTTTTETTTSTPTGGVSGSSTSESSTATGGVSGASTSSSGGVGGISTPNTGVGAGAALLTGVLLMTLGGGLAALGTLKRRS